MKFILSLIISAILFFGGLYMADKFVLGWILGIVAFIISQAIQSGDS